METAVFPTPRYVATYQVKFWEWFSNHYEYSFLKSKETQGTCRDGLEDAFLSRNGGILQLKKYHAIKWLRDPKLISRHHQKK